MNTRVVIEEIQTSPEAEWFWYQPPCPFKPMGIVVWGGDTVKTVRIGNEEQLIVEVPAQFFACQFSLERLKELAKVGLLLRVLNNGLVFPSMNPSTRLTLRITGNPSQVAVYGVELIEIGESGGIHSL